MALLLRSPDRRPVHRRRRRRTRRGDQLASPPAPRAAATTAGRSWRAAHCHYDDPVDEDCPAGTPPCFSPAYTPADRTSSHTACRRRLTCAIIGGFRYRGTAIPELLRQIRLRATSAAGDLVDRGGQPRRLGQPPRPLLAEKQASFSSFGQDADGELYIAASSDVCKLVPAANGCEQTRRQQRCINNMNRQGAEVAKARLKTDAECVRATGLRRLDTLGLPPGDQTADDCFAFKTWAAGPSGGRSRRRPQGGAAVPPASPRRCRPSATRSSAASRRRRGPPRRRGLTARCSARTPTRRSSSKTQNPVGAACQADVAGKVHAARRPVWKPRARREERRARAARLGSARPDGRGARRPACSGTSTTDDAAAPSRGRCTTARAPSSAPRARASRSRRCSPATARPAARQRLRGLRRCERVRCHFCRSFEAVRRPDASTATSSTTAPPTTAVRPTPSGSAPAPGRRRQLRTPPRSTARGSRTTGSSPIPTDPRAGCRTARHAVRSDDAALLRLRAQVPLRLPAAGHAGDVRCRRSRSSSRSARSSRRRFTLRERPARPRPRRGHDRDAAPHPPRPRLGGPAVHLAHDDRARRTLTTPRRPAST